MDISAIWQEIVSVVDFTLFKINETPINLGTFLKFVVVVLLFVLLSRFMKNKLLTKILAKFRIDIGTRFTMIRISQYIIVFIGIVVAFQTIGIDLSGLAVVFGFLSVGIGFGLQNITSNFIAGLILLFERPINVGDRVTVGEKEGDVLNINIRSTTIRSLNNISIIVPNSDFISKSVTNWSHGDKKIRLDLDVGVSYSSDLDLVLQSLQEVAEENKEVLKYPQPEVHFVEFGDSSWNMRLRLWIPDPKRYYYVRSDINCAIVRKFRERNVEIPFPQRDLHLRSAVTLPHEAKEEK